MSFLALVFVNLRRHKVRTLIGVSGISFGVAAMLTILSIVLGAIAMFERILASDSQYLVFERDVSDLFFSSVPEASASALRELPFVEAAQPVLFGIVSSPGHPIITCFGVEADDARIAKAEWLSGDPRSFGVEPGRVYLGERAAGFLKAKPGDAVPIGRETFTVGGVLRSTNGFEDGGVFLPLADAQAFFHRDGVSSVITVKLRDKADGDALKQAVAKNFPTLIALENREFSRSYSQFKIMNLTGWAVGICAFLLGGLGVANTMIMSVFGRIREIAVLRACGFSGRQIAALVLSEAAAVAAAGTLVGFTIGAVALAVLGAAPQLHGYINAVVRPDVTLGIIAVAFFTGLAGAMYPAWFASRIQPSEALRYE